MREVAPTATRLVVGHVTGVALVDANENPDDARRHGRDTAGREAGAKQRAAPAAVA